MILSNNTAIGVMQVVDTLDAGGAERIAVHLANMLPPDRFASHLCTTRRGGALESELAPHVTRVSLNRKTRFDGLGLHRMLHAIREHSIQVLHAHGSSLFISRLSSLLSGRASLIWHDHYGRFDTNDRSAWLYRIATRGVGVIAVNQRLADWSRSALLVPADHVWYVPNWVEPSSSTATPELLPGASGRRIICVANLRAQKDHMTLLRAMVHTREVVPDVQLSLVGDATEPRYAQYIRTQIASMDLSGNVTWLGPKRDVFSLLRQADIGVLSSLSEGLPLALLEYGTNGLAVAATDVGDCREVLDDGRAGLLVPPSSPERLAEALIQLLQSPELRGSLSSMLKQHIAARYDAKTAVARICAIYDSVMAEKAA